MRRSSVSMCSPATYRSSPEVSGSALCFTYRTTSPNFTRFHVAEALAIGYLREFGLIRDHPIEQIDNRVHLNPEVPPRLLPRGPHLRERWHVLAVHAQRRRLALHIERDRETVALRGNFLSRCDLGEALLLDECVVDCFDAALVLG